MAAARNVEGEWLRRPAAAVFGEPRLPVAMAFWEFDGVGMSRSVSHMSRTAVKNCAPIGGAECVDDLAV